VKQEPLQNEDEFKRRKIEEWKSKMGLQSSASGIDFDAIKRKVAEASQRLKGVKQGLNTANPEVEVSQPVNNRIDQGHNVR
jgi:hypothetical protein